MLHGHEVQHGVVHGFDVLVERGGRIVSGSLPACDVMLHELNGLHGVSGRFDVVCEHNGLPMVLHKRSRSHVPTNLIFYQVFVFVTAEYENSKNSLNQVSLWDRIIPDKDHANVQVEVKSKYPLIDQGTSLRGKKVQLVLHWHIMPNAGRMMRGKMPLSEFNLPDTYTS
ncbi:signal peptidase complex subunit 3-like [Lolium rigidum]|uniref:signal peptidase complex subunit 3-like n=1 Tax=Lolium rigidum TaxID=89674 RepID=UPI001F5D9F0E|nr:signal peptidase complex subunit 3-like [Lolium rigidum]